MEEEDDFEIEVAQPKKKAPKSRPASAETRRIQKQIAKLVSEGRPVPNDLRMQLSFSILERIDDEDKKLRGLMNIIKTFKTDEVGIDDFELAKRTPKEVLQAIAKAKDNKMRLILKGTE